MLLIKFFHKMWEALLIDMPFFTLEINNMNMSYFYNLLVVIILYNYKFTCNLITKGLNLGLSVKPRNTRCFLVFLFIKNMMTTHRLKKIECQKTHWNFL